MTKASFDAKEFSIQAVDVAIARNDPHQVAAARAKRHLTAIRTIGASGNSLCQFPGTRLMTIRSIEQRSRRTHFDAVAALRTVQPAAICSNHGIGAAPAGFNRVFTHPLVTDARAALT